MSSAPRCPRLGTCIFLIASILLAVSCGRDRGPLAFSSTIAGLEKEFGEPFGLAVRDGRIYVSDGERNEIRVIEGGKTQVFASGLNTPSAIAFESGGQLVVADTGSHTIIVLDSDGRSVQNIIGTTDSAGYADGDIRSALFRAPTGLAVDDDNRIFVADTYNDRIRVIENGSVRTIAGAEPGFADGTGERALFHTPNGIAVWNDKLLVADTGNRRIRVVEPDGAVWTLAGDGHADIRDGLLLSASFYQPTGIAVTTGGEIFVTDGNAIRKIAGSPVPTVTTISGEPRGFRDGRLLTARFSRPSLLALIEDSLVIADSDNRVVRMITTDKGAEATSEQIEAIRDTPEDLRNAQPPRWPYDPAEGPREIAGTFGELRGAVKPGATGMRFHNGLDIAGAYGETARFIRTEKVLRPRAAENFNTLRELVRMPTLGYIHIRLGRDQTNKPFDDARFVFARDSTGKLADVRIPRGSLFNAGEAIGTLNAMNHVHLVAGRSGSEMNAIDALAFPGIADAYAPTIEKAWLTDTGWDALETKGGTGRIQLTGKVRVLMRSFDRMDGNSERRRLGLYRVGYQILNSDGTPASDMNWTMTLDRLPDDRAVRFVYADGSISGATGETVFNYIVSNRVDHNAYREDFLDTSALAAGSYVIRAVAADYFGNTSYSDIPVEVLR